MAKQKYEFNHGERIIYKVACVRHGFWGAYTDTLVVTNQAVILEQYGLLNNFKGVIRYPYCEITQAIIGQALNGEKQLELYCRDMVENFAPQTADEKVLKTLALAINDQLSTDAEFYDYSYYQTIMDRSSVAEEEIEYASVTSNINDNTDERDFEMGLNFIGNVANNVLKSGNFSVKGIKNGLNKATKQQTTRSLFGAFKDEILDDFGIHDIQDIFTEIGNDFREEFDLPHKMTHEEIREMREEAEELRERQEERKEQELKRKKEEAYNRQVEKAKQNIKDKKAEKLSKSPDNQKAKMSIADQLEALKKLKELLDANILTQEEFDNKKQEILKS